jgi:hypothetical protein
VLPGPCRWPPALRSLGLEVRIRPVPVEVEVAIPFADDREHAAYDAEAVSRWWRMVAQADRVLKRFRGRFLGKASPVHFFWGSFDLAATRFSGRRAPAHPGGAPNCPNYVMTDAYSHECSSVGFWPGGGPVAEAAFYSYAYPEPPGYAEGAVRPLGAGYRPEMREFVLPYEAVRGAADPDAALLDFCQSTYEIAADLGRWDRHSARALVEIHRGGRRGASTGPRVTTAQILMHIVEGGLDDPRVVDHLHNVVGCCDALAVVIGPNAPVRYRAWEGPSS